MLKSIHTVAILGIAISAIPASGALILDNSSRGDFQSGRVAEFSPLAAVSVAGATSINQIGAMVDLNSAGNLKFVIFNLDTLALLFSTGSSAYADNGLTFKVSPVFAPFVLNPGINYGIGAIADVGGGWQINNTSSGNPFVQN